MEDRYELHQAGYQGPYYIISAQEASQPRTIISSDRTVATGTRAAMEAALKLMLVGEPRMLSILEGLSHTLL
jgi:hypothetical protein